MKVLFLTGQYPFPQQPERCAYSGYIAQALARHVDIDVVSPQPWVPPLPRRFLRGSWSWMRELPEAGTVYGVPVRYPRYLAIPRLTRPFLGNIFTWLLRRHVGRNGRLPYDVVHASWLYPEGIAAAAFAAQYGVPSVVTALGSDAYVLPQDPAIGGAIRRGLLDATVLTGVSRPLCRELEVLSGGKVPVVYTPNGIDATVFSFAPELRAAARQEIGAQPGTPLLVFVGRLEPVKQVELLLRGWAASALSKVPGARLVVIGEGTRRQALEEEARASGAPVEFLGQRGQAVVARWLAAATLVCLSSKSEGMPNLVLEALASGTPVVSTAVGGVPDLIDDRCGVLAADQSPAAYAAAIDAAGARQWDPAAVAACGSQPWEKSVETYLEAYRLAVSRGRSGTDAIV